MANLPARHETRSETRIAPTNGPARARYAEFLPHVQALTESETAPGLRLFIVMVAVLTSACGLWAGLAEIDQVARAPAVIRPLGKVKIVNHPEGGRIKEIAVADGNRVAAGDVLMRLDADMVGQDLVKGQRDWQAFAAAVARLEGEATGRPPSFPAEIVGDRPDLVQAQNRLYQARRRSIETRLSVGRGVVEQRAGEAARVRAQLGQAREGLAILKEQEQAIAELANKGYFPRLRYLSVKRQVSEAAGRVAEMRQAARAAAAALAEAGNRVAGTEREWRSEILTALGEAKHRRDLAKAALMQNRARSANLVVRAPVAGIVQNLAVTAPGQSIRANETLLNIVPSGSRLVVEARVSNADIGHIARGQKARVKIRTFDFTRYGALDGIVEDIAADSEKDEKTGKRWFSVTVRTEQSHLGQGDRRRPVVPGMEADVDLHVGRRTVLSYLTDRLQRTAETAFRDR